MKLLPRSVRRFSTMIKQNYLYVDKTRHAFTMITQGKYYFLSRPRRFGKSLFVSMLKELLIGRHVQASDAQAADGDFLLQLASSTYETLIPLYHMAQI